MAAVVEESVTEEVEEGFGVWSRSVHVMRGGRDGDGSVDPWRRSREG